MRKEIIRAINIIEANGALSDCMGAFRDVFDFMID
jgi:hypothetical protein